MAESCVLALDLGTTAFKAAAIAGDRVVGKPAVVPSTLDYGPRGAVTCDPALYIRRLRRAVRLAARSASAAGLRIDALGISSQAQTYVALDERNEPIGPAVVWTDSRATSEAEIAGQELPNFAQTCGFLHPTSQQFLPKVMRSQRLAEGARRFLLLNEYIIYILTGEPFGDNVNQGMGGFYDIAAMAWNDAALQLAQITADQLAAVYPAGSHSAPLKYRAASSLGLPSGIPVYSCGNDQSCSAVGAGVRYAGDVFANFGTAMVVYTLKDRPPWPRSDDQIAGISPLPDRWFLLGVESEFGNVVEWLAEVLFPRRNIGEALRRALEAHPGQGDPPRFEYRGGGRLDVHDLRVGACREIIMRALLRHYSNRFGTLLRGVVGQGPLPARIVAAGGMSRSREWLTYLGNRHHIQLEQATLEHAGLVGIAHIIRDARKG